MAFDLGWNHMRFLRAQTCLANFIEQAKGAPPIDGHAAAVLTPYALSKLQNELVASLHYTSFGLEGDIFLVRQNTEVVGGCRVTWNQREELISCSCQMFESSGILCLHALRVLLKPVMHKLDTWCYFQIRDLRWRSSNGAPPHPQGVASERVEVLQSMVLKLVSEVAKSNERMDLATHEVSVLLSRIKQQPVSMDVSDEN
ncbi:hypothetical protein U9M48_032655, partial [Paspalum notatum var. saurae]